MNIKRKNIPEEKQSMFGFFKRSITNMFPNMFQHPTSDEVPTDRAIGQPSMPSSTLQSADANVRQNRVYQDWNEKKANLLTTKKG